jgi:PST family polysaccharide transporter
MKPSTSKDEYFKAEHLKSDLKKHAVRGAGAMVFSQSSNYLIQMIGTIILARILAPDDFGLVAMVTSISGFFLMFRRLGLTEAIVQTKNITHLQVSTLFWINLAFGMFLTLILCSLSPLIASFYGIPKLTLISVVSSTGFVIGALSTQHLAILKRNMQFSIYAINEISGTIVGVIASISLALIGWGYWAIVARPLIATTAMTIGAWLFCKWRPGLPSTKAQIRQMLKFGMNVLGNYSVNYFSMNLDKTLIGWRHGASSLGHYDRAFQLFLAPAQQFAVPITSVAVATLSRLQDDHEKYRRYYINALSMVAFIGFPVSALLTVMGRDIVSALLGSKWTQAGEIFSILGIGMGVQILYATNAWLHLSQGRADRWFRWGIAASIVIIISFFIGLPFGAIGVAVAYTAAMHLLIGPSLHYAGKLVNLKLLSIVQALWKYYIAAVCAGIVCKVIVYNSGFAADGFIVYNLVSRLFIGSVLYTIVYLLFIIILYQSVAPIKQFLSIVSEMIPGKWKKNKL